MTIHNVLKENEFAVKSLLRRYRVLGPPTIETVKKAHDQHGAEFMTRLVAAITDTDNFSAPLTIMTPENPFVMQALQYAQEQNQQEQQQQPGKFWKFWYDLLGAVGSTAKTIGQAREDVQGSVNQQEFIQVVERQKTRSTAIYVIAGLILIIVLVLLFTKK